MDEIAARDVLLVKTIETVDQSRELLSDDDRKYANRSARELAQWDTADSRNMPASALFLRHRAQLLLRKLGERQPAFASFSRRRSVLPWMSLVLPALAFLLGAGVDRIGNPHRVDLLSAPLILIVAWNVAMYAGMLVVLCLPRARSALQARLINFFGGSYARIPRKTPAPLAHAVLAFAAEWAQRSARLSAARLHRALHLAAAFFAIGAIASLYLRGMLSQYAAGWESTFLDAGQVHAFLSVLFTPALAVFPLQGFSVQDIELLRFGAPVSSAAGARWVHLYAATLFLLVVLPRIVLAAIAHWQVRRRRRNFPLDLQQPYFQRLVAGSGGAPGRLRVLPYSFTVDEARDRGLAAIAAALLGDQARVSLRPAVAYGEDLRDTLDEDPSQGGQAGMTAALFNLVATPEPENHGAFLKQIGRACKGKVTALLDVSGFVERVGTQAGGQARVDERIALWKEFCRFHGVDAVPVNLLDPQSRMPGPAGEWL
jgi:hypothetical protein